MSEHEPMVFDNVPTEIPVTVKDKDRTKEYILTELTGPNSVEWTNITTSKANMESQEDGSIKFMGMKDAGDMDIELLSLCLYHKDSRAPVNKEIIRGFKYQVIDQLAKKAKEINGMNVVKKKDKEGKVIEETDAKN